MVALNASRLSSGFCVSRHVTPLRVAQNVAMTKLKHHFRAWREETTDLTQEDVAGLIERDVSQVSRIEKGRDVTLEQLSALAAAIGQKNPLRLLFPPGSVDGELFDVLMKVWAKTPAQRRQVLRMVKSLIEDEGDTP